MNSLWPKPMEVTVRLWKKLETNPMALEKRLSNFKNAMVEPIVRHKVWRREWGHAGSEIKWLNL